MNIILLVFVCSLSAIFGFLGGYIFNGWLYDEQRDETIDDLLRAVARIDWAAIQQCDDGRGRAYASAVLRLRPVFMRAGV